MAKTVKKIDVRLSGLLEQGFHLQEPSHDIMENLDQNLDITINTSLGHAADLSVIVVRMVVLLSCLRDKNKPEERIGLVNYDIAFNYEATNWAADKEKPLVPYHVAAGLVGTTYSTVRGLLFARCGSSVMRDYVLPMMHPNNLLKGLEGVEPDPDAQQVQQQDS